MTRLSGFSSLDVIDPDKTLRRSASASPVRAAREALRRRQGALVAGRSHLVETTLAGLGIFRHMAAARRKGYRIVLHFVSAGSWKRRWIPPQGGRHRWHRRKHVHQGALEKLSALRRDACEAPGGEAFETWPVRQAAAASVNPVAAKIETSEIRDLLEALQVIRTLFGGGKGHERPVAGEHRQKGVEKHARASGRRPNVRPG